MFVFKANIDNLFFVRGDMMKWLVLPESVLYESLNDSIIGSEINKKILDESAPMLERIMRLIYYILVF